MPSLAALIVKNSHILSGIDSKISGGALSNRQQLHEILRFC